MAPTLAPPAGGFKWKDDEYWNSHEGLMTQTWPHKVESRERTKNKPMTINMRTLSAANLPTMTIRPRDRPSTVPANMPSQGKRFLDNIDMYMGKPITAAELDSRPSTPGGRGGQRSSAERRVQSQAELGRPGNYKLPEGRNPFKDKFRDNNYVFSAGMGRAEPLNGTSDQDRIAYGLAPRYAQKPLGGRRGAGGPGMVGKMSGMRGMEISGMGMKGISAPYTNNAMYGMTVGQAERPSSAAQKGREMKLHSNVIMGM